MPKLTARNLYRLMSDVVAHRGDNYTAKVTSLADPSCSWLFNTLALTFHRVRIASMLSQLQVLMWQSEGADGMPWFNAMRTRLGEMWGNLDEADRLLAIGRAAGMVRVHTPRTDCDIPYAVILDRDVRQQERTRPIAQQHRSMLYWSFAVNRRLSRNTAQP